MTNVLDVEWRHVGEDVDSTCERCAATGRTLQEVLDEIRPMLSARRIRIRVRETVLPHDGSGSPISLFNGIPIEDLIDEVSVGITPCISCSCITGTDAECRALICGDRVYEDVPAEIIRQAALKAVGL